MNGWSASLGRPGAAIAPRRTAEPGPAALRGDLRDGTGGAPPSPARGAPRSPLRGRHLAAVGGALAIVVITLVFARALSEAGVVTDRAAVVRAQNARLQERLDAGRREVEMVQGEPFTRLQARAYGFGEPGERAFALVTGAPSPAPIVPLGASEQRVASTTPLEDWLELLFGR